eukprot:TRINITY_DN8071_c0_g1_i1.p1 TRINITY_DN8071_c0_g1~~TRINITY_DN8071_c0_g1_i1.p1  ORF type:complete len:333 (+),score=-1.15 TRINITY_DN8071_c0_g1_i1:45-1001(+)
MVTGTIVNVLQGKNCGFIKAEGAKDVYFSLNAFRGESPVRGLTVSYTLRTMPDGRIRAVNVRPSTSIMNRAPPCGNGNEEFQSLLAQNFELPLGRVARGVLQSDRLDSIKEFISTANHMAIIHRKRPAGTQQFFRELARPGLLDETVAIVNRQSAKEDIRVLLQRDAQISPELQRSPFFETWLDDMAAVTEMFSEALGTDRVCFWLGSHRGCGRYHVDRVSFRLLVTYKGIGTEWLPEEAVDREAWRTGLSNDKILKDKSAVQNIPQWDVAVFRGGPEGVIHRTPDQASRRDTLLMRLDHPSFYDVCRPVEHNGKLVY